MFGFSFGEVVIVLIVALLVVGPKRLPELGAQLGRLMRAWRMMKFDYEEQFREATQLKKQFDLLKNPDPKSIIKDVSTEPKTS